MFIRKGLEATVRSVSETFPVLLLTGPRQSGRKTLLAKLAAQDRRSVNLDHPSARLLARTDPELFLQRHTPPVLIAEVQQAPQLFPYIKILADQHHQPGDFWLTSSLSFPTMPGVTESMAGRAGIVPMLGLGAAELDNRSPGAFTLDPQSLARRAAEAVPRTCAGIFSRIFTGSVPLLHASPWINREQFFEAYLDTHLSHELHLMDPAADETAYIRFIQVAAARTATPVNCREMARETGITARTAKKWLSILVSSGIVTLIQPFPCTTCTSTQQITRAPLMFFLDTGLCAHIMGWSSAHVLERNVMSSAFFATWVVSEICRSYLHTGRRPPLFHCQGRRRREMQFALYADRTVHPLAVSMVPHPENALRNFPLTAPASPQELEDAGAGRNLPAPVIGTGGVICMTPDLRSLDENIWSIPSWCL